MELIIVEVDLKKRSTPSQGVAIKKNSVSSRTCHFYRLTSKPDRSKILISKLDDHKIISMKVLAFLIAYYTN